MTDELADFRTDVRAWIADAYPAELRESSINFFQAAGDVLTGHARRWQERLAAKGYGAPTWPVEYGGAGLSHPQARVVNDELARADAVNPISMLSGMGVTMVGPTVLEYGTDDQKAKHLPGIASGEVRWCLGLSEPGAGSDLASLTTRAVDDGDNWVLNGQKIWTSGADRSHWCGALVRTNADASKRDGISFVMLPMDQPGVRARPIKLIAGASPFCETFFEDARAEKADLLGKVNEGWSVIKRLLQHERQSQTGGGRAAAGPVETPQDVAKRYVGVDDNGLLDDADLRTRLASHLMDAEAHGLTQARIGAEARGNVEVTAAASIMKNSATLVAQTRAELMLEVMGSQGVGWEGPGFSGDELASVRGWLSGKAMSIYGGSSEVQRNIISKNILGLPETTQKG